MDQPFGWDLFDPSIPRPDQEKDPLWISFLSSIALELPPPRAEGSSQIFPIMFHTTSDPGLNKGKIQRQIYADSSPFLSHFQPTPFPGRKRAISGTVSRQYPAKDWPIFIPVLSRADNGLETDQDRTLYQTSPIMVMERVIPGAILCRYQPRPRPVQSRTDSGFGTDQDRIRYQTDPIPFPTHSWADSGLSLAQDRARS